MAGINPEHLAVLKPLVGSRPGSIERALCKRWSITDIICRQSGGVTERLWRDISFELDLTLWMIRRPVVPKKSNIFNNVNELLHLIQHVK